MMHTKQILLMEREELHFSNKWSQQAKCHMMIDRCMQRHLRKLRTDNTINLQYSHKWCTIWS